MSKGYEILTGLGLATSIALGSTACSGSSESSHTACVGVDFSSPKKGGPPGSKGSILMYAFPKLNRNFGDARVMDVSGKVIKGNDAGQTIQSVPNLNGTGEFALTWDLKSKAIQSDVVHVQVDFEGKQYTCPDTTVRFDPTTYTVTPQLPNSPY